MNTNISQKEQKEKLFALNKRAFVDALLNARPKDYQERNWFYQVISLVLSYPLQLISILAGSYLLFDIARFVWQLDTHTFSGTAVFGLCVIIFVGIESLRRWLVNTAGYHYVATFRPEGGNLIKGEYLQTKIYCLLAISLLLITSGTIGAYQYIKNNSPKAETLDLTAVASPIEGKISQEKARITQIDGDIQKLLQAKNAELKDFKSYALWQGKEYLLPEVKQRHTNYDRQINEMQQQRKLHQDLINRYEAKLEQKEQKTENLNLEIISINTSHKELYAGVSAGIWLCFELLLVFMLSYTWVFKYGVKGEILLEQISFDKRENTGFGAKKPEILQQNYHFPKTGLNHYLENKNFNDAGNKEIGFEKWYEKTALSITNTALKEMQKDTIHPEKEPETKVIIKEVPVIREVFIDREVEVIHKEVENEGFPVTCAHCGKQEVKKRPAKFCSNACRNKSWKESHELA